MTDTRHWCNEGKQGPHPMVMVGGGEWVCPAHPARAVSCDPPFVAIDKGGGNYDIVPKADRPRTRRRPAPKG